jgi:hypothetical protein
MTLELRLRPLVALLGAGVALGACSNAPGMDTSLAAVIEPARAMMAENREARVAGPLRPTAGFPGLDPALIAGRSDPMMGAVVPSIDSVAGLVPGGAGNGYFQWRTADNVAITLAVGGLVTSTRGLGADLHASDVAQSVALVAEGRAGQAERRHVYLDGVHAPTEMRFTCTVQPQGRESVVVNGRTHAVLRIDETCAGQGQTFINTYWRDAGSVLIRQSTQWLGPELGVIHLQRLID